MGGADNEGYTSLSHVVLHLLWLGYQVCTRIPVYLESDHKTERQNAVDESTKKVYN